jgi:hypothetical protein
MMSTRIDFDEAFVSSRIDLDEGIESDAETSESEEAPVVRSQQPLPQIFHGLFDSSPIIPSNDGAGPRRNVSLTATVENHPHRSSRRRSSTDSQTAKADRRNSAALLIGAVSKTSFSEAEAEDKNDVELGQGEQQAPAIPSLLPRDGVGHGAIQRVGPRLGDFKDQVRDAKPPEPRPLLPVPELPVFKDQMRLRKVADPGARQGSSRVSSEDPWCDNEHQEPHQRRDTNAHGTVLVSAQLVADDSTQLQQQQQRSSSPILLAVPVATSLIVMTKLRLVLIATVLLIAGIAAVVTAVVLSSSSERLPGPTPDLLEPTEFLYRQWFETGNIEGDSDDELGTSVAISRNGLAFAATSPGSNTVFVYLLGPDGFWELVTSISAKWGRSVALADSGTILAISTASER